MTSGQSYSRDLELPQPALDDPDWQDSVCLWFHDRGRGVGGFFRIGRHPRDGQGRIHVFAFSECGWRFRRYVNRLPLAPGAVSSTGMRVHAGWYDARDDDTIAFGWDEPECDASLRFSDFYTPRDWGHAAYSRRTHTGGHLEVSGRIVGVLRFGGEEFAVDGLAHRDHSWGLRRVRSMGSHRLVTGTTGPAFSFATLIVQWQDQPEPTRMGFVVRHGESEEIAGLDVVAGLDIDGLTVRWGSCSITLADGERIDIAAQAHAGQLTEYENLYSSDNICSVRVGGDMGFCDFEVTNNPQFGTARPGFFTRLFAEQGLRHTG
jgi:hypothetical protein